MLLATTTTKRPTHRKKYQMCSSVRSEDNYSLPGSHKYTVVSSVCSPAFVIGSTKTLAVKYTKKKKGGTTGGPKVGGDFWSPTGTPTGTPTGAPTPTGKVIPPPQSDIKITGKKGDGFPKSGYSGRPKKRGPYKPRKNKIKKK